MNVACDAKRLSIIQSLKQYERPLNKYLQPSCSH